MEITNYTWEFTFTENDLKRYLNYGYPSCTYIIEILMQNGITLNDILLCMKFNNVTLSLMDLNNQFLSTLPNIINDFDISQTEILKISTFMQETIDTCRELELGNEERISQFEKTLHIIVSEHLTI